MEKNIKKIVSMLLLCCLTACCKHKLMNQDYFAMISTGSPFELVTKECGEPYDLVLLKNGITEYRYIQRNQIAPGAMEHIHFIITVSSDGRIINKKSNIVTSSAELNIQ